MKVRIRKSAIKGKRLHGYRAKPKSHMPRGTKHKKIKLMLKARKKRRARIAGKT